MAELYCGNCGQPLRDTDNFCPKCGTRVERDETEEQAPVSGSAPFKPQTQAEEGIPSGDEGKLEREIAVPDDPPDAPIDDVFPKGDDHRLGNFRIDFKIEVSHEFLSSVK